MKKFTFFLAALLGLALLTSCEDHGTWRNNNDNRWYAGEDGSSLYGFIDQNGKMVIETNYLETWYFSCGWVKVKEGSELKFIDVNGKSAEPDPFPYEYDNYFAYNRIRFKEGDKFGMYDENFKQVIPANYDYLGSCTADDLILFSEDGNEFGYMDPNGKVVIDEQFEEAYEFIDGIAVVEEYKNEYAYYGVIDKKGNMVLDYQKKDIYNLGEERLGFYNATTKKYGMMDKKGNEIVSAKYDDMWVFTCGLLKVEKNGKYGFLNAKGEEVVPCRYASAYEFCDDLTDVYDADNNCTIINTKGETEFKLKDGEWMASYFINGLGCIGKIGSYHYVNHKNETIYKWSLASDKAPAKKANLRDSRREMLLSTPYGSRVRDMERAKAKFME